MKNRPIYLEQLINFKDKDVIKVITGVRRCGKSSLMMLFKEYLINSNVSEENILNINLESLEYEFNDYKAFYNKVKEFCSGKRGKVYLLIDEVQKLDNWELAINSMRVDFNCDIYITGSNAYLLSSQLATYLSGRYVEIKMLPLSFKEFLYFYTFDKSMSKQDKFNLYLNYGGMPGLSQLDFNDTMVNQLLDGIFSTVLMKDVIGQAEVRDTVLLNKIIRFLADNIGNNTSINNIKNILTADNFKTRKITSGTIDNYIELLQNAFIFYGIKRYDIKGKDYLKTQGKYYIIDTGIRNNILGYKNIDRGHVLENVVYLELLRRGYDVSIGFIKGKEIDFIATNKREKKYIQVTETMINPETREREIMPLKFIKDNYEKIILTNDSTLAGYDDEGIKIINLVDWLIDE